MSARKGGPGKDIRQHLKEETPNSIFFEPKQAPKISQIGQILAILGGYPASKVNSERYMSSFIQSQSGAVTVDWVVLTAGLVGLGLATMAVVSNGVEDLSGDIRDQTTEQLITTSFLPGVAAHIDYADLKTIWYDDQTRIIGLHDINLTNIDTGYRNNVQNMRDVISGASPNVEQINAYAELERAVAYYDTAHSNDFDLSTTYDEVGDIEALLVEYETAYGCRERSCS